MRYNQEQRSFSSGEVSSLLRGRTDYQRVQTGLRQCRGFLPTRQGAVTRAPGTVYRGNTRNNLSARLLPFIFAADDAVTLEVTAGVMRVWRYGSLVMKAGAPYEIAHDYNSAAAVQRIKFVQSADVIYMVDGNKAPRKLSRLALNDWIFGPVEFDGGPFRAENFDEAVTIKASAETGTITLTGTGGPFSADMVGTLIQLRAVSDETVPTWTGNTDVNVGDRMRNSGRVYEVVSGTDTIVNPPIHTEGTAKTGKNGPVWKYISDDIGIARITGYTNANSVTAQVKRRIPAAIVATATHRWSEGAWSARHGYPAAIAIHDQRLVFAATPSDPRTIWFSASGDFTDFFPGTDADDSFAYSIGGVRSLNRILWLQAGARGLHIGALGEEYSSRTRAGEVLSATNPAFGTDTTIGSLDVQPVAPDGRPIFIARDRRRVFELRYAYERDQHQAVELSLPAEHLGVEGFQEVVWQSAPTRIGWIRRGGAANDLAALIYDPAEEVLGWATYPVAGGQIEGLCVTPTADGSRDVVTLVVKRTIGGQTVRFVEEMSEVFGGLTGGPIIYEANHLFAAKIREDTNVPFINVGGLEHLEGQLVHCWTDVGEMGPYVVSGGMVTLDDRVIRATVGLFDATHQFELLDQGGALREGGTIGRSKRISAVGFHWHRTTAGQLQLIERRFAQENVQGDWRDIIRLPVPFDMTRAYSGLINVNAPSGWCEEITARIRPVGGAPMTLLGVTFIMEIAGG